MKVDTRSKTYISYKEEDCEFSEPVFVPRPGGTTEDDGVLLVSVFNMSDTREAGLAILDAADLTCLVRAKVRANGTVTHCFHGQFAQDADTLHMY